MKIVRFRVSNFIGIKQADISPGKITVFAGENDQGKTSMLKAMSALFKGAPLSVIHHGTERAEIFGEMEDLQITRIFTHKTSSVSVKDARGFTRPAPQKYLDGLLGDFAFNPMEFLLAEKKGKILLKAMDVTVTKAEVEAAASTGEAKESLPLPESGPALAMYADTHKHYYSARTEVNRRLKTKVAAGGEVLKKLPEGYKPVEGIEEMAVATRELISEKETEIAVLEAEKKAAERAAHTRATLEDAIRVDTSSAEAYRVTANMCVETPEDLARASNRIQDLTAQLREAEADEAATRGAIQDRDRATAKAEEAEARIISTKATLEALPGAFENEMLSFAETVLAGLNGQRKDCDDEQARQRIWNEAMVLRAEAREAEEEAARLSALVERFGSDLPAQALRDAKLPIEGLAIAGDQVTIAGTPIDDLSTSEQIKVTLAIARALIPEGGLQAVCIDGWERLDNKKQAEFIRLAEGDGIQYWMARVGEPRPGEIGIAGGKVAAA